MPMKSAFSSAISTTAALSMPSKPVARGSYFTPMYQLFRYGRTASPRSPSIARA